MSTSPTDINSLNEGAKYWRYTIGVDVLPANSKEKRPLFAWKRYQAKPTTDKEFQYWLDNNEFRNGLCIITGKVRHRSDRQNLYYVVIDGDKAAGIKELLTRNGKTATIQEVSQRWIVEQHKDNIEKAHFGFYSPIRFPEKAPDNIIGLEIRCEDLDGKTDRVVVVSPSIHKDGQPYEIIGTKDPQVLTVPQARELIQHINQICIRNGVEYLTKTGNSRLDSKLKRMIKNLAIDQTVTITEGQRNDMLIAVADSILFNHSHKVPEEKLREYFDAINEQICKPPLDDKEIDLLWDRACDFVEVIKERERTNGNNNYSGNDNGNNAKSESRYGSDQEDISLPTDPKRYGLDQDVYGILNIKPTVLAVARSKTKQIVKAKITESKYKDASGLEHKICTLDWICTIIDAYPIEVVRNTNPLDEKGKIKYTVTFAYKNNKPFTIGPATVNEIVEGLADNGRIMKRLIAADALTSLLAAYEDTNKIKIDDQIPTPGYYWIDGRIVGYHVTQRLDFDPWNNEDHRREVSECIKIFDEWQQRNKKKVALPTSLKWTTLAPFAFITKTHSRGVDKWLPNYYLYLTTDTGKTTLIRDGVLAPWRIYSDGENSSIHFKGPGSLDSPSKFGIASSQTTLPVLGDEIGNMFNDSDKYGGNNILLEMQKFSVQNKYIRTRFNENILALTSFAFTSNDPPPNDGAARRRFFAIQFHDNEVWTEDEKKDYERWMNEVDSTSGKSRREKLCIYGDFVTSYITKHPELVIGYSSYSWNEPATTILKEFYKVAGIESPPTWLDLLAEQTIVQETKEERQFEFRGFLRQCIAKSYKDNVSIIPDTNFWYTDSYGKWIRKDEELAFKDMLDYCIRNKTIPFLHECKRNSGQETDIAITSNIKAEMKRYDRNASSVTMETIASKIPDFIYDRRWIGKDQIRVACGPLSKFEEYLDYEIKQDETK